MSEEISREEAKQLIDEAKSGLILAIESEAIPTIGDVPVDEMNFKVTTNLYEFGDNYDT